MISTLHIWLESSHLLKNNQLYIEEIYKDFLNNPDSVDISWHKVFIEFSQEKSQQYHTDNVFITQKNDYLENNIKKLPYFLKNSRCNFLYAQILKLITAYRMYGHQYAKLDPLKLQRRNKNPLLELENYNFTPYDFQQTFNMNFFNINKNPMTVSEIYEFLKITYCSYIGIEYMHIADINESLWIQNYFESQHQDSLFHLEEKEQFLQEIVAAEGIEHYLGIKFPGTKRFSLEGAEALIPMLKEMIRYSVNHHNIQEIFFGMAHRGRLNVLTNVLGKNAKDIFDEFYDKQIVTITSGDVKYHQGFHSEITINKHTIQLFLSCNPSHLEVVSPVVMGSVRARIDQLCMNVTNVRIPKKNNIILPVIIHGDAAIIAQGIVQETFNMSKTRAYNIEGTIHIIINNQIGFTTSNPLDIRSTQYCTDIAKMVQAPILHVNADNLESVISVIRVATNFRNLYKRDVVIDLVCYRRHGHNEVDEPRVTQPIMYKKIHTHPTLLDIYSKFLNTNNVIKNNDVEKMIYTYRKKLEENIPILEEWNPKYSTFTFKNNNIKQNNNKIFLTKKIDHKYLQNLAYQISNIPSNIVVHDRVKKIYYDRQEMALNRKFFDWGAAETLAYATLLDQGISIRLSGEDVTRGTFFHRHLIIYDQNDGTEYIPLMHIRKNQGNFYIWDSVLSEEATLAFEYGYSNMSQNTLTIWEAQFGDFSNGSQIIIDQFISSSQQKWNQSCNLIMLLPHGYEGQGPEHSSARIERYLQLCAENNMQICIPSNPSQIYHLFRQHAIYKVRKPLIIISPKSLLRHSMVTASLEDLTNGIFKTVLNETNEKIDLNKISRVIICSGKIYYDLLDQQHKNQQYTVAIIRIEQLYPFPYKDMQVILSKYILYTKDFVWCQEEPQNQGAWHYIKNCFDNKNINLNIVLNYIGRPVSASPAVGYFSIHQKQQKKIIDEALNLN